MKESNDTIRIFCRLRPTKKSIKYVINQDFKGSTIELQRPKGTDLIDNTREVYRYKFDGIVDQEAQQEEVYQRTAESCVMSALDGFNSTIFAYGQTGSGKTYTMTGGPMHYEERGVIPRCIHTLYEEIQKRTDKEYTITISFMEIYNNKGYDLLDKSRNVKELKDLEKVEMLEDTSGNMLLKNIRCLPANAEDDALNLLFVGDDNRTMCETPQNPNSSRSHCIFTVNIESRVPGSSSVAFSKLHLVDLAGSERVHKHQVTGSIFTEAKNINLSLHFLEQVIVALSEGREHVPYRNSMMTTVLRDSIGGNCKTVMIATINPDPGQLMESISTCRFAQRVASVTQHAVLNKRIDPYTLIKQLKKKVSYLKERLAFFEKGEDQPKELDLNERAVVHEKIRQFVRDENQDTLNLGGQFARVQEAFLYFKKMARKEDLKLPTAAIADKSTKELATTSDSIPAIEHKNAKGDINTEEIENLKVAVNLRDIEIDILVGMISQKNKNLMESGVQTGGDLHTSNASFNKDQFKTHITAKARYERENLSLEQKLAENHKLKNYTQAIGMVDRAQAFEHFRKSYRRNEVIEKTKSKLKGKYADAKVFGGKINSLRGIIGKLKAELVRLRSLQATNEDENDLALLQAEDAKLVDTIKAKRDEYTENFEKLKELKRQIQHIQRGLENSRIRLQKDFEQWYNTTNFNPSSPSATSISTTATSPLTGFDKENFQPTTSLTFSENSTPLNTSTNDSPTKLFTRSSKAPPLQSNLRSGLQSQFSKNTFDESNQQPLTKSLLMEHQKQFSPHRTKVPSPESPQTTSSHFEKSSDSGRSSVSGLNPKNPLLKKLAGYMRLPGASQPGAASSSINRRSLLQRSAV